MQVDQVQGQMNVTDFDLHEVVYLHPKGAGPLHASVYQPRGKGPFPTMVEVHGGAWCMHDRTRDSSIHEALARSGVAVVAVDFLLAWEGAYPIQAQQVNYGIRWTKTNARRFNIDPDRVGIHGQSSGGHMAMLMGMRPDHPRYNEIQLPAGSPKVDASLRCVSMMWPVINPIGRYRHAKKRHADPNRPKWTTGNIQRHDAFWKNEENMAEGSPLIALQKGEKVETPPALWIQPRVDDLHVYQDPDSSEPGTDVEKFVAAYRKAGGTIDLEYFDDKESVASDDTPDALRAFQMVVSFVHKHLAP